MHDKEIPKERYTSPGERHRITDDLRLIQQYNNGISKIKNLLENRPNQSSKFRTRNWIETNDAARGTYNTNNQVKIKTSMVDSNVCDYRDAYILVSGTVIAVELAAGGENNNLEVVFKNCAPFAIIA